MRGAGGASAPDDVRGAARLLARLACNGHTLCDDELRPFGVGLYPLGAMVNHGEAPNAAQGFRGAAIEFRRAPRSAAAAARAAGGHGALHASVRARACRADDGGGNTPTLQGAARGRTQRGGHHRLCGARGAAP